MNIKNSLYRATVFYQENNFAESLLICQKILAKKNTIFEAMYLQAINYQAQKHYQLSLDCFMDMIKIHGEHANVLNALANNYIGLNDFDNAKKYCSLALRKEMNFAEALNNLAVCEQNLGDIESAEKHYKKAILLKGDEILFRLNLAKLYKEIGWFENSNEVLVKMMDFDGDKSAIYFLMYENFMYMHQYEDALGIADLGLVSKQLKDIDLIELLVGKAILFWLFDNIDEAEQAIILSEGVYSHPKGSYENLENLQIFHTYLKNLIVFYRQNTSLYAPRGNDLYFISESHGFAPNNMKIEFNETSYNIRSLFVKGAKVFHFTQANDNRFKASLAMLFDGLPLASKVIFAFGEIDCRYNEGILKYCLAKNKSYQTVITDMLTQYIALLVSESTIKQFEIMIYGVPAPHPEQLNHLAEKERELLKNIISFFNVVLRELCLKHQLTFLDVYKLTDLNGESNLKYHIDSIHIHPLALATLFAEAKINKR